MHSDAPKKKTVCDFEIININKKKIKKKKIININKNKNKIQKFNFINSPRGSDMMPKNVNSLHTPM